MHLLSQNQNGFWFVISLGFIFLITPLSFTMAEEVESTELKQQQQELQQLLKKIEEAREQRSEQKELLEKLNKKMECNWSLIQDYDACDKKYKDNPQEQLECAKKSKERARECLSDIDK